MPMSLTSQKAVIYHELSAIARTAASLVEQVAPGRRDAYWATSALVACALAEIGGTATGVRGLLEGEPHFWLETEGFRVDIARELYDDGPLVEPVGAWSGHAVYDRHLADWPLEDAVDHFASLFDFPAISRQRARDIFDHIVGTFAHDRVA